jgi:hypothetical protein
MPPKRTPATTAPAAKVAGETIPLDAGLGAGAASPFGPAVDRGVERGVEMEQLVHGLGELRDV